MNARILSVVFLWATLVAGDAVCQRQADSEQLELTPQRIVGLRYPRLAHLALVQGRVELEALVSPEGAVKDVKVVSGHPLLVAAARDSLRQWRFTGCTASRGDCTPKVTFIFILQKQLCDISECPEDLQIDLSGAVTMTCTSKSARAIIN
jgi:TonB family protein